MTERIQESKDAEGVRELIKVALTQYPAIISQPLTVSIGWDLIKRSQDLQTGKWRYELTGRTNISCPLSTRSTGLSNARVEFDIRAWTHLDISEEDFKTRALDSCVDITLTLPKTWLDTVITEGTITEGLGQSRGSTYWLGSVPVSGGVICLDPKWIKGVQGEVPFGREGRITDPDESGLKVWVTIEESV